MMADLPRNADPIIKARAKGQKPAGPVLVCMTKQYGALPNDAIVYVEPGVEYEWGWTRDLESIVVLVDAETKLGSILTDIRAVYPKPAKQVDVVDVETRLGWLVCFASPLLTVKWPQSIVDDWLGSGSYHRELHEIKAAGIKQVEAERARWN